jgi:hypothetical protein
LPALIVDLITANLVYWRRVSEASKRIFATIKSKLMPAKLNVLKRIGRYLNKLGRLTIYYSFILSNFNYCSVTWHFCSEKNTKKMEKIQERALRFIYNDYVLNYEELLEKIKNAIT